MRPGAEAMCALLQLYLVTDAGACLNGALIDVVAAAVQGGVTCVQLRAKQLNTREFIEQAIALKTRLAPLGTALVVNDRVDVALACDADGVHLGQTDMPVRLARAILPPHVFIGLSVEGMQQVLATDPREVDYLAVSPIFSTPTKIDTGAPWQLAGLRAVRAATRLPLVAIGGISASNAARVLAAGADGIAVVSALCSAPDPRAAAMQLKAICTAQGDVSR